MGGIMTSEQHVCMLREVTSLGRTFLTSAEGENQDSYSCKPFFCLEDKLFFRTGNEWIDFGLPLSTTSDEACKLYDASLSQIIGFYEDPSLGGLAKCMNAMLEADPTFVMGHVISNGIKMTGTMFMSPEDPIRKNVSELVALSEKQTLSSLEELHVKAVQLMVDSDLLGAIQCWETLLRENPLDMLALRQAFFGYSFLGLFPQQRDMVARIFHHWNKSMPLFGYLYGYHAFALQETNFYGQAEREARLGLEINKKDIYASHALCHVMEMQGRPSEGITHLRETERDWGGCDILACHIHWHESLFHIEKGNYEEAFGIFDSEILPRYKKNFTIRNLADGSSLLYRLQIEGVKVGDRWKQMQEGCRDKVEVHLNTFHDPHFLMTCLGAEDAAATTKFMDSFKESVRNGRGHSKKVSEQVLIPLCEAMVAHDNGDFEKAVDLTYPIRYNFINVGGSNAQRDVFSLFLIDSALKSCKKEHNAIGRELLIERKALRETSPLTDRLMERALAAHDD